MTVYRVAWCPVFTLGAQTYRRCNLQLPDPEYPGGAKRRRGRSIWPWLLLLAVTLVAIYAYGQAVAAWEDMVRMWRDLVQLFWWIIPDERSAS
jgi:hypothetical protein